MSRSQPNILFIVMDTARAKTVLNNDEVLPNFHRLATDGTQFTNAFTTAPWTLPSHASMFTGQYTSDHNTHAGTKSFEPDVPTVPELLHDAGYQTVAFSNNVWIAPEFGFDRGFEEFKTSTELVNSDADISKIAKEKNGILAQSKAVGKTLCRRDGYRTILNAIYSKFFRKRYDSGARLTNWRIRRWLSKSRDSNRPFFLFVNYLEPHLKYEPPEEFCIPFLPDGMGYSSAMEVNQDAWRYVCGEKNMDDKDFELLSALYKGELAYLDYRLGQLFEYLENNDVLEDTMVVITGDHGENIGEHGLMDHQYCLYDTLLNVPLLVRYPERFPSNEQCEELVELRDIAPTVLNVGTSQQPANEGVSTKPLQVALEGDGREYVVGEYAQPQPSMEALKNRTDQISEDIRKYDRGLRSIRTHQWKLIEGTDGKRELYQVSDDPSETRNIAADNRKTITKLQHILDKKLKEFEIPHSGTDNAVESGTRSRLEDLGYLQ